MASENASNISGLPWVVPTGIVRVVKEHRIRGLMSLSGDEGRSLQDLTAKVGDFAISYGTNEGEESGAHVSSYEYLNGECDGYGSVVLSETIEGLEEARVETDYFAPIKTVRVDISGNMDRGKASEMFARIVLGDADLYFIRSDPDKVENDRLHDLTPACLETAITSIWSTIGIKSARPVLAFLFGRPLISFPADNYNFIFYGDKGSRRFAALDHLSKKLGPTSLKEITIREEIDAECISAGGGNATKILESVRWMVLVSVDSNLSLCNFFLSSYGLDMLLPPATKKLTEMLVSLKDYVPLIKDIMEGNDPPTSTEDKPAEDKPAE